MQNTPFHAYYTARKLASAYENGLVAALASSNIEIYPYQIASSSAASDVYKRQLKGMYFM